MISLDHALWFHRSARADEWLYYDVETPINTNGRGLLRGRILSGDGHLLTSASQEMRLIRYEAASPI